MDTTQCMNASFIQKILACIHSLWIQHTADPEATIHIYASKIVGSGIGMRSDTWPDKAEMDRLRKNATPAVLDGLLLRWSPFMALLEAQVMYCSITDALYVVLQHQSNGLAMLPLSPFMEADPENKDPDYLELMDEIEKGHDFLLEKARALYNSATEQEFKEATLN